MVGRVKAGELIPEDANKSIFMGMVKETLSWADEKRQMFVGGLAKVFEELGKPKPDFKAMMEKAKSM